MEEKQTTEEKNSESMSQVTKHEDAAMKIMMQFFADELMERFGIEGKVSSIAPTESVYLELKKMHEDFNFEMEDGTWKHFEFQSTNEGKEGLRRFRAYEAVVSCQHSVEITTYVLYSGTIRNPMTELTEGINTYRIFPIIMQDWDADLLLKKLKDKIAAGEPVTKPELVELVLCPLMRGNTSQKDRILAAYKITRDAEGIIPEEKRKIEAVIYTMADKFLDSVSMEEVKEAVRMTKLGQMLVNDGIQQGIQTGITQGVELTKINVAKSLFDVLDEPTIAERVGLPLETVKKLKEERE